jgi:CheY-like chemotaxis protein
MEIHFGPGPFVSPLKPFVRLPLCRKGKSLTRKFHQFMAKTSLRLLVVDDSEQDAALLRTEIEREGYQLVLHRVDSEMALVEALHATEWDLVIADESMPRMNSREALAIVKRHGRDIPFILYSGTISSQRASQAMRDGVQDYVCKGEISRLIPSIERELRNAAIRKAAKKAESHVYRLAYYDSLTGLPNRNYLCERMSEQFAAQPAATSAVVFLCRQFHAPERQFRVRDRRWTDASDCPAPGAVLRGQGSAFKVAGRRIPDVCPGCCRPRGNRCVDAMRHPKFFNTVFPRYP